MINNSIDSKCIPVHAVADLGGKGLVGLQPRAEDFGGQQIFEARKFKKI